MMRNAPPAAWRDTWRSWLHPRVITMLFLGFSAGIPILLIFSTLSAWLTEAGVKKSAVTFFSWAALGYSFKFVWAPLIDRMPLPWLTARLGRRRSWMVVSQLCIMAAILLMALIDPASSQAQLTAMAWAAVLLGFSSATQDIVIDAYRIESADKKLQAMLSATYIAGYRIGMLVAGAGSLALAGYLGTSVNDYSYAAWKITYVGVAFCMCVG
ncbi:MAG: MFS transporter, partial [Desulfofustis sp.]